MVRATGRWTTGRSRYDADGRELWVARYSGPGGAFDAARKVVVDQHGNVYVTGESAGAGTGFDYATVKYDSNGNELWVARYNGTASGADFARDLAVDEAGCVYVTGSSTPGPDLGTSDYVTIKYDPQGNELWVARYNGPGNADDGARAIAVDQAGQVYVTGNSAGFNPEDFDYATVKYDASGTELWVARHAGPVGSFDFAVDVAVDAALNVYVTGIENGDYGTVKYDADGNPLWVARYNGPANATDQPRALGVDDAGNVIVTGISFDDVTDFDYATVKYDANGTERWVARYNGPANAGDSAFALAVDDSHSVYVTGNSIGTGTSFDYATVKYDASGNEAWVARFNGPASSGDSAVAIAVDSAGNVSCDGIEFQPRGEQRLRDDQVRTTASSGAGLHAAGDESRHRPGVRHHLESIRYPLRPGLHADICQRYECDVDGIGSLRDDLHGLARMRHRGRDDLHGDHAFSPIRHGTRPGRASTPSTVHQMTAAIRPTGAHPLGVWANGLEVGLRTLRREPILGLKRLALPVSYWRSFEFAYVWRRLDMAPGTRVLDLGSPKDLAAMLARHRGYEVIATDILPEAIVLSQRYARAQRIEGRGPGRVHSEVQDGRALSFPDGSFDAAYSVSVLEHIPDDGDTAAIRELIRVVRPGGVVVVTVPFDRRYRETFVDGPVYERTQVGREAVFFERHYDAAALSTRLLRMDGVELVDLRFWGEGAVRVEALLDRLGPMRLPLSPLEALLATASLRQVDPEGEGHPMAASFTLRRTHEAISEC